MARALELAKLGKGCVLTNPCVGAVVVRNGEIIGEGWHKAFGDRHAEINAFDSANNSLMGSDLYVTLEPCCHTGKTPPCTEAIIQAGIARVFVGMIDPSMKVNGGGIEFLRSHGVQVFVCEDLELVRSIRSLNQEFVKNSILGLPYVVMKAAVTLDGKIATASGESKYITGEAARNDAHLERSYCDAVLVGAGTVRNDNPTLASFGELSDKNLLRIVVGGCADLDLNLNFFRDGNFLYFVKEINGKEYLYEEIGGRVLKFANWLDILKQIYDFSVGSVYVEGGASVFGSLFDENLGNGELIDKVLWYVSPKIIGGNGLSVIGGNGVDKLSDSVFLSDVSVSTIGSDVKICGYLNFR